jgi:glycosyltransferase involved in cell wall biosynthesis
VISTSKGAEGLDLRPGRDLIVADTPEEFAQSVIGLLDSPQSRSELSQNGRKAVAEEYGWPRVGERTLGLLDSLRPRTAPRTYSRLLHAT